MPFTPFHLGPAVLISGLSGKRLNLIAISLGSTIIDVRAAYCLFTGCYPLHGPLHTYIGATIIAILISILLYSQKTMLQLITDMFGLKQDHSFLTIFYGSLLGTWSHVFLDSFLYTDMLPFWPLKTNPFSGLVGAGIMYTACTVAFFIGSFIYIYLYSNNLQIE